MAPFGPQVAPSLLGLDPKRIRKNTTLSHFVEAFAKNWRVYI